MRIKYYLFVILLAGFAACDDGAQFASDVEDVKYLRLSIGGSHLLYYGSHHSNDPADPMFCDIENKLSDYSPDLILVEGGYDSDLSASKSEALSRGEFAFINYLGRCHGNNVANIEPPNYFIDSILQFKFYSADILAMYILRQIDQFQRESMHKKFDFVNDILISSRAFSIRLGLIPPSGLGDIAAILRLRTGIELNAKNWKTIDVRSKYMLPGNICYDIWSNAIDIRDKYARLRIIEAMQNHERVFVAMGYTHLDNQKQLLKSGLRTAFSHSRNNEDLSSR